MGTNQPRDGATRRHTPNICEGSLAQPLRFTLLRLIFLLIELPLALWRALDHNRYTCMDGVYCVFVIRGGKRARGSLETAHSFCLPGQATLLIL